MAFLRKNIVTKSEMLWVLRVFASHFSDSSSKVVIPDRSLMVQHHPRKVSQISGIKIYHMFKEWFNEVS